MRVLYFLLGLLGLLCGVSGQTPIPNRPDGYSSPTGGDGDSAVVLEIFVDLLCPDSSAAWPTIESLIHSYGGKVQLLTHLFPLPYHTWSFIFAQGAYVVDTNTEHNLTAIYNYFDFSFNIQPQFYNQATADLSTNEIVSQLATAVEKAGILTAQAFTDGINDSTLNWDTRVSWKYACSRSVTGTPAFLINGVSINADQSWNTSDWHAIIDPLICPASTAYCQYTPTAFECCTAGEMCIPNVGCRC